VARLPQLLFVVALLGATAAAFAVTERLKLERSPITGTTVDPREFSPVCECTTDVVVISFVLRRAATITVQVLDADNDTVRTLVRDRDEPAGRVSYTWDGRDNADRVVPEGRYHPFVEFQEHGRTINVPTQIRVDTTAPQVRFGRVFPRVFSPDGDGSRDRVSVQFTVDEPSRPALLVDGRQRVEGKVAAGEGRLLWHGNGTAVRPGVYELRLRARDRSGNRGSTRRVVPVLVRFVTLSRERIEVEAGTRFSVRVSKDAARYSWLFAGERGTGRTNRLRLRAPAEPGEYRLYVVVGSHADSAEVIVTEPTEEEAAQ
jgi:FlgD Ig-like domain